MTRKVGLVLRLLYGETKGTRQFVSPRGASVMLRRYGAEDEYFGEDQ
jgi:hypothetical protein